MKLVTEISLDDLATQVPSTEVLQFIKEILAWQDDRRMERELVEYLSGSDEED